MSLQLKKLVRSVEGIKFCAERHLQCGTPHQGLSEIFHRANEILKEINQDDVTTDEFPTLHDTHDKIENDAVQSIIHYTRHSTWREKVIRTLTDPRTGTPSNLEHNLKPLFEKLSRLPNPTKLRYLRELRTHVENMQKKDSLWLPQPDSIKVLQKMIKSSIREVPVDQLFKSMQTI